MNAINALTDDRRPKTRYKYGILILIIFSLMGLITISLAEAGRRPIWNFDMGTDDSPVWQGFIKVTKDTVYTQEWGYGWDKPVDNAAFATAGPQRLPKPDPLSADWVGTGRFFGRGSFDLRGTITFNLDLPNGRYRVYLLTGDYLGGGLIRADSIARVVSSYSIKAEGKEKVSVAISKEEAIRTWYYRHLDDDYHHKDQDVWEKYVVPRFKEYTFSVDIQDGQTSRFRRL